MGAVGGSKALCAPIWTTLLSVYRLSLSFYMDSLALFRRESQPETEMVSLLAHPRVPEGGKMPNQFSCISILAKTGNRKRK